MRNAYRIAGFGLAAGTAVMLALSAPALARGGFGAEGGRMEMMPGGAGGGLFAVQFADLDSDGDGLITEAELTARAEALVADAVAGVDTDGDGAVTAEEMQAQILARIAARGEARGPGLRAGDPATMAKTMADRMLAARDADGDGRLTGTELVPAVDVAQLIDRFDSDDDNAWSQAEFDASRLAGHGGPDGRGMRTGERGGPAPVFRR